MGSRIQLINSVQNKKVQFVRSLLSKSRSRRENQAFVVEGVRLAEEAHSSGWPIQLALFTDQLSARGHDVINNMTESGTSVEEVAPHVMESLSKTETSQGLLAVVSYPGLQLIDQPDLIVIADGIRDPGNLGTLLRTSAAAGAQGILLAPGTADPFAPKVVRAAMGAHFKLPTIQMDWPQIRETIKNRKQPLFAYLADSAGGTSCWDADLASPCALIIGGEAQGASLAAIQLADSAVHIPMPGGTESLNAAIAASILLFEAIRQRRRN